MQTGWILINAHQIWYLGSGVTTAKSKRIHLCFVLLYFQIPVFALFRKWKAFSVWRRNVRTKKTMAFKKSLNENLFIINPVGAATQDQISHILEWLNQYSQPWISSTPRDCPNLSFIAEIL